MIPFLKFKRACVSFSLQRLLKLQVPASNIIAHSKHAEMSAYGEEDVSIGRREKRQGRRDELQLQLD